MADVEGGSGDVDGRLADLLVGSPHNLVSARLTRGDVLERHVGEARRVGENLDGVAGRWMDLGTGGGIPGLILADVHRAAEWVLVDATRKKAAEAERFAAELGIPCRVLSGRVEGLAREPEWRGTFDGVVARAVASLPSLVELARGFLRDGGRLVAVKGSSAQREIADAKEALNRTRMVVESVVEVDGETRLINIRALGRVPEAVPRRSGVPQRRPW